MIRNNLNALNREGQIRKNKNESLMKVVKYNNSKNILVKFINSGYLTQITWGQFCSGSVKNPYDKNIFNVGFIGEGKYKIADNGIQTKIYKTWNSMLMRCYDKKFHKKYSTYKDCSVCEQWHNFQNFAEWFDDNYYEIEGERMHLDKDILVKGNKVYSPDTCMFVPQHINALFVKTNALRGKYPIGVSLDITNNKFKSKCKNGNEKVISLGYFNTPEEAFNTYKFYKEKIIKQFAEEYKDKIPKKLYEAMVNYEVEITD